MVMFYLQSAYELMSTNTTPLLLPQTPAPSLPCAGVLFWVNLIDVETTPLVRTFCLNTGGVVDGSY